MIATNHAYKSPLYTFTENTIKSPVFWYFQDYKGNISKNWVIKTQM